MFIVLIIRNSNYLDVGVHILTFFDKISLHTPLEVHVGTVISVQQQRPELYGIVGDNWWWVGRTNSSGWWQEDCWWRGRKEFQIFHDFISSFWYCWSRIGRLGAVDSWNYLDFMDVNMLAWEMFEVFILD